MNTIDDTSKRGESSEKDERLRFTLSSFFSPSELLHFLLLSRLHLLLSNSPPFLSLSLSPLHLFFPPFPFPSRIPNHPLPFLLSPPFSTSSLLFPSSFNSSLTTTAFPLLTL